MVRFRDVIQGWKLPVAIVLAAAYRRIHPDLWIVSEDAFEARDNGLWFFRYVRAEHPEQECVYAIHKCSQDYERVSAIGQTVEYGSLKHWVLYLASSVQIISQKSGDPNVPIFYFLQVYGLLRNNRLFLQHGITINNVQWLSYQESKIKRFLCGAYPEYLYVRERFGYPEENVCYTGMCRFDGLHNVRTEPDLILIMPTWRNWLVIRKDRMREYEGTTSVSESDYFVRWREFLLDESLKEIAEHYRVHFVFYPHRNMQQYLSLFPSDLDYIEIAGREKYDIQELLKRSAMLITDYSSVFFDMVYMKKPVIFYQFDYEMFRKGQYQEGYFDYTDNPFGACCRKQNDVFDHIRRVISEDYTVSDSYLKAHAQYFPLYDTRNTERAYEIAKALSRKPN